LVSQLVTVYSSTLLMRRLADRAQALVVSEGLSVNEATALLLETPWAIVLSRPAPTPGA
jgi:hypothetical protein